MKIGIPKEIHPGERRVALVPAEVAKLVKAGHVVSVQTGAGQAGGFADVDYEQAGAELCAEAQALWQQSHIICKVRAPETDEAARITGGKLLISLFAPAQNLTLAGRIAGQGGSLIALDAVPRLSRAQKLDVLSSMANIAGYRAVMEAGQHFERFFPGQITAAGKVPQAQVLVIGAGVAGLAAIGTAVSLGAAVRAFDTRPEVAEQVASLNAEFITLTEAEVAVDQPKGADGYAQAMGEAFLQAERRLFAGHLPAIDIVISTALIPGKPAPVLITEDMLKLMRPGSVVVDLAAEQGGNCALCEAGRVVQAAGVTLIGYTDFPSRMASQASQLFSRNINNLLDELKLPLEAPISFDLEDPVIRGCLVVHGGEVLWPPPPIAVSAAPVPAPAPPAEPSAATESPRPSRSAGLWALGAVVAGLLALGTVAPPDLMQHITVFVLACLVGWQVIWNVTPALHTPLMSVTNAISGIIVLGAMLQVGAPGLATYLALIALVLASLNIAGGFLITRRMLGMFRRDDG